MVFVELDIDTIRQQLENVKDVLSDKLGFDTWDAPEAIIVKEVVSQVDQVLDAISLCTQELLADDSDDLTLDPIVRLKKLVSDLKHSHHESKKEIHARDLTLDLLRGKLKRKDNMIEYIRTTLYKELMALKEQIVHAQKNEGTVPTDMNLFDFLAIINQQEEEPEDTEDTTAMQRMQSKLRSEFLREKNQLEARYKRMIEDRERAMARQDQMFHERWDAMVAQYEGDVANLKAAHQAEVQKAEEERQKEREQHREDLLEQERLHELRIVKLNEEFAELEGQLKAHIAELTRKNSQLEGEMRDLDARHQGEMASLERQHNEEVARIRSEYEHKAAEAKAAHDRQLADMREYLREAETRNRETKERLEAEIERLLHLVHSVEKRLKESKEMEEQLQQKLKSSKEEHEKMKKAVEDAKAEADAAKARAAESEEKLKGMEKEVSGLRDAITRLENEAKTAKKELETITQRLTAQLHQQAAAHEAQVASLRSECETEKEQIRESHKHEMENVQRQHEAALETAAADEKLRSIEAMKKREHEFECELGQVKAQIAQEAAKLEERHRAEMQDAQGQWSAKQKSLEDEIEELKKKLAMCLRKSGSRQRDSPPPAGSPVPPNSSSVGGGSSGGGGVGGSGSGPAGPVTASTIDQDLLSLEQSIDEALSGVDVESDGEEGGPLLTEEKRKERLSKSAISQMSVWDRLAIRAQMVVDRINAERVKYEALRKETLERTIAHTLNIGAPSSYSMVTVNSREAPVGPNGRRSVARISPPRIEFPTPRFLQSLSSSMDVVRDTHAGLWSRQSVSQPATSGRSPTRARPPSAASTTTRRTTTPAADLFISSQPDLTFYSSSQRGLLLPAVRDSAPPRDDSPQRPTSSVLNIPNPKDHPPLGGAPPLARGVTNSLRPRTSVGAARPPSSMMAPSPSLRSITFPAWDGILEGLEADLEVSTINAKQRPASSKFKRSNSVQK